MNLVKICRVSCGLTQKQLADLIGTTQNTVSAWETVDQSPDALRCFKLGYLFGLDPVLFLSPCQKLMLDDFRSQNIPFILPVDIY